MNFTVILLCIFVPACVALLFHTVLYISEQKASSQKATKDKFTVSIPNICATIGTITAIVSGSFILLSPWIWPNESDSMIIFYVIFGALFWLGIYLIMKTIRFRIVVEKNQITVYPLFARAYTFTFEDINSVERQTKNMNRRQAERIVIRTKQGRKVIAEDAFIAYFKLVDKIQACVDVSKLKGFEEQQR